MLPISNFLSRWALFTNWKIDKCTIPSSVELRTQYDVVVFIKPISILVFGILWLVRNSTQIHFMNDTDLVSKIYHGNSKRKKRDHLESSTFELVCTFQLSSFKNLLLVRQYFCCWESGGKWWADGNQFIILLYMSFSAHNTTYLNTWSKQMITMTMSVATATLGYFCYKFFASFYLHISKYAIYTPHIFTYSQAIK